MRLDINHTKEVYQKVHTSTTVKYLNFDQNLKQVTRQQNKKRNQKTIILAKTRIQQKTEE